MAVEWFTDMERLFGDRRRLALAVVGVLVIAIVPFTTTAYVTELFFLGLMFVMLGVSWNLLAGYAGQISLGHAAFFGLGAFVSAWLTTPTRAGLPEAIQVPMAVSLVGAIAVTALLALVTGPVIFRLTGHYFAIGTLALATIIQLVLLDQRRFSGGSTGYYVQGTVGEDLMFLLTLAATIAIVLVTYRIVASPTGLAMRAIHGDEGAASSLGVNPLKYKMYAYVVSSAMAGLAGGLYAQFTLFISPDSTLSVVWMVDTLVVVIIGGMGTMLGPLLGAAFFVVLDNGLQSVAGEFATTVEGLLIILFIIFAPSGLYGLLQERVFGDGDAGADAGGDAPADAVASEVPDADVDPEGTAGRSE